MITFVILLNTLFFSPSCQEEKIWQGKTFFYDVYCKKRNGFYTVEMQGPKYYSIEIMPLLNENSPIQTDTIAQNANQSIIRSKNGGFTFSDKRWVKCNLKEKTMSDNIKQRRLGLFYGFLYLEIQAKANSSKIPAYEDSINDFQEYDKFGDIDKIIKKYINK